MVAMVPFDWQAHDTYFVVAHFHYVLIGGMVFPMFAAIYHWTPMLSEPLSERLGKVAFWLMFIGFNTAFLPMHLTGLIGMPRRVHTYPEALNWGSLNLISTIGAFVFAAGVLVVLVDLARRFRPSLSGGRGKHLEVGNAGVAGQRCLRSSQHPARRQPRSAVVAAGAGKSGRARPMVPPGCAHRLTRDFADVAGRGRAAGDRPSSRSRLGASRRGRRHGRLLSAADGQVCDAGFRLRRRGAGSDHHLDVAKR